MKQCSQCSVMLKSVSQKSAAQLWSVSWIRNVHGRVSDVQMWHNIDCNSVTRFSVHLNLTRRLTF